jgi:transposase
VVERTGAWLNRFRRLRIRDEKLEEIHQAFLELGCALICWNRLQHGF